MNKDKNIGIAAYGETKITMGGGRSAYDMGAEVLSVILQMTGFELSEIDGLAVAETMSDTANPFWPAYMADMLGLSPTWLECLGLGGVSAVGGVARAVAAIEAGFCTTVLVLSTDAQSSRNQSEQGGQRLEFQYPTGLRGPVGAFGLLTQRYRHLHDLDDRALAKLAVTQRSHGLLNPNACEKLRKPLTIEDYLKSKTVSDPLRMLDSVMVCDGANGVLVTTRQKARQKGLDKFVVPTAYAELTNYKAFDPEAEITESGFSVIGPKALAKAGMKPTDVAMFHPYDDFLIAILLQLEQIGFCSTGEGSRFILEHDFTFEGDIPLNTGGGQISAGQPGLAGGGVNLTEAVRQMFCEGGDRQVKSVHNALVTGIGTIPIGRNWASSGVLVLEQ
ncbi:thiolase [Variovorax sp. PBS-H4]|uniref:thiolase family protein n=1 Tax=Variovorax sp. PBS-H4 TaxID=434008 RepID=UPI001318BA2A|nr:thiolase family protein [Variovorax sp. PBS-H4]VTU36064.1 thiolase [Variovorax sp. PBS-H4]